LRSRRRPAWEQENGKLFDCSASESSLSSYRDISDIEQDRRTDNEKDDIGEIHYGKLGIAARDSESLERQRDLLIHLHNEEIEALKKEIERLKMIKAKADQSDDRWERLVKKRKNRISRQRNSTCVCHELVAELVRKDTDLQERSNQVIALKRDLDISNWIKEPPQIRRRCDDVKFNLEWTKLNNYIARLAQVLSALVPLENGKVKTVELDRTSTELQEWIVDAVGGTNHLMEAPLYAFQALLFNVVRRHVFYSSFWERFACDSLMGHQYQEIFSRFGELLLFLIVCKAKVGIWLTSIPSSS
jgi:hypothetical protein